MDHFLIKLFDEVLSQAELVSTNLNYILHDLLDESEYCIGLALELFLLFLLLQGWQFFLTLKIKEKVKLIRKTAWTTVFNCLHIGNT